MIYRFEEFIRRAKEKLDEMIYGLEDGEDWDTISEGNWQVQRYGNQFLLYHCEELVLIAYKEKGERNE